jgi:uncharacterized protein (DUF2384 family)
MKREKRVDQGVADLLGITVKQLRDIREGLPGTDPENARVVAETADVLALAELSWSPETTLDWMQGSNPFLDGARPIDVIRLRGAAAVIEALKAANGGAYS